MLRFDALQKAFISELQEQRQNVFTNSGNRVVLRAHQPGDIVFTPRAIAKIPDARAAFIQGKIPSAVHLEQDQQLAAGLCDHPGIANQTCRTVYPFRS
jgi:hypothetical protein